MWLRRLWRWAWSPSQKFSVATLVVGGVVLGVLFWGGFNTAIQFTNRTEFCISCHEMKDTVYPEYTKSVHYLNASGVRAGCPDCHVPRPWAPEMIRKVQASGELYYSFMGTINTPEKFEAHRLELAQKVWATMTATDSRECRNCHSFGAMDFHKQRPAASGRMQKAAAAGETCISCHKGIAHHMPDMSQGLKMAFADLKAEATNTTAKTGDVLYGLTTKPLFIERPDSASGAPDGRLIAATPVKVLKTDGDWLQVEIGGWQQQGAERMIYALQGQRIFAAALGPPAVDKVQTGAAMTDKDTDQVWSPATLTAWIGKDDLVTDLPKLWSYGEKMYGAACGSCHSLQPTTHFLANEWIGNVNAMRQRISLDDEQVRFLEKYLQMHAQDTETKG
jgi:trimethylamine-N-oxide reductase (cytochrome c), cytochrome c-type subunit TorC